MSFLKGLFVKKAITDIDGNIYHTLKIGNQFWLIENLKVTRFRNGDKIPNVTENTDWASSSSEAYCCYDNDTSNTDSYGYLYNWHTINDNRIICPKGWHIPTLKEWKELEEYLGGGKLAFDKMKEPGTSHWKTSNESASNDSGFTSLPSGFRLYNGNFDEIGINAPWWTSTEKDSQFAYPYAVIGGTDIHRLKSNGFSKNVGFPVRCLKD